MAAAFIRCAEQNSTLGPSLSATVDTLLYARYIEAAFVSGVRDSLIIDCPRRECDFNATINQKHDSILAAYAISGMSLAVKIESYGTLDSLILSRCGNGAGVQGLWKLDSTSSAYAPLTGAYYHFDRGNAVIWMPKADLVRRVYKDNLIILSGKPTKMTLDSSAIGHGLVSFTGDVNHEVITVQVTTAGDLIMTSSNPAVSPFVWDLFGGPVECDSMPTLGFGPKWYRDFRYANEQ
jgi:hypothetical protein